MAQIGLGVQDQAQRPMAELRPFRPADIPEVVDLHLSTIGANSGRRFLERAIYPTMLHPTSTGFGFVGVRDGKVVGFVVGMLDTSAWRRTLVRTRAPECLLAAAQFCLRGWNVLIQTVNTGRYFSGKSSTKPEGHVFALAIDGAYQDGGLGVELVQAFLDYCRSHGMTRLWTKTPKANRAVQRICRYVGARVHGELNMSGETHVVYYLDFDKADGAEEE